MPNHIQNIIDIEGDQDIIDKLKADIYCKLNSEELKYLNPNDYYFSFKKIIPQPIFKNEEEWYDWNIENWGTKWDAYHQNNKDNQLSFQTAWYHCRPVIKKLSMLYPTLTFKVQYADEDTHGKEQGIYDIKNGVIENRDYEIKARDLFAHKLHGGDPSDLIPESCNCCHADVGLNPYFDNIKRVTYWFCELCASTFASNTVQYNRDPSLKEIMQAICFIGNKILTKLENNK